MSDQPVAYIQIRDPEGKMSRAPVFGDRVLIGRSTKADVRLERESISRFHAELVRDPFGRWIIRDLGSRSGVKLRGGMVKQSVLRYGEQFELGKYELKLWNLRPMAVKPQKPMHAAPVAENETSHASVSSLADVEPPKIDTLHLTTLTEFGQRLAEVEDPNERLRMLARFIVRKDFHGLCAMALRLDKRHPTDPPQALCEPQSAISWDNKGNYVSRSLLRAVRTTRSPVLANNVATYQDPGVVEMSIAPETGGRLAAIACPLADEENTLDVLYVVLQPEYGTPEWLAIIALASTQYQQAESIWVARQEAQHNARIEADLASARKIQERLVPRKMQIEGVDFAITFQPCEWVGGDYVDVVRMNDGRVFMGLADVSGHGLPASLIALSLHSMVHAYLRYNSDLIALMTGLNEHLCEYLEEGAFVTMAAIMLDPRTGELQCVNAGHPPVAIIGTDAASRTLQVAEHHPLGLLPAEFTMEKSQLQPGDILAMYSDGLTEVTTPEGRLLGIQGMNEQLSKAVRAVPSATAHVLAGTVVKSIEQMETNLLPEDDRSFLVARWAGV